MLPFMTFLEMEPKLKNKTKQNYLSLPPLPLSLHPSSSLPPSLFPSYLLSCLETESLFQFPIITITQPADDSSGHVGMIS